jgi:hypothetical protein
LQFFASAKLGVLELLLDPPFVVVLFVVVLPLLLLELPLLLEALVVVAGGVAAADGFFLLPHPAATTTSSSASAIAPNLNFISTPLGENRPIDSFFTTGPGLDRRALAHSPYDRRMCCPEPPLALT